jgi:hypothetical protein
MTARNRFEGPGSFPTKEQIHSARPWKQAAVKRSAPEAELELQLRSVGLHPNVEVRFDSKRKWRLDFYFPTEVPLAVEVEGGGWVQGRHTRGAGFQADIDKYNALTLAGIRLLRVTPQMVKSGEALRLVEQALGVRS